jgi:hypothetical protein
MLENLTISGRELLIAVVLATVVYLIEVLLFSRRRKPGIPPELLARIAAVEAGMATELAALKARLEALELRPPAESALDTQSTTHAEAVRMARQGLTAPELVERLGISRSEAELIIALHRADS